MAVLQDPVELDLALWVVGESTEPVAVGMVGAAFAAIESGAIEAVSIAKLKLMLRSGRLDYQSRGCKPVDRGGLQSWDGQKTIANRPAGGADFAVSGVDARQGAQQQGA